MVFLSVCFRLKPEVLADQPSFKHMRYSQIRHPICFPAEEQQTRLPFRAEGKTLPNYTGTQGHKVSRVGTTHGKPPAGFKQAHRHCKKHRGKGKYHSTRGSGRREGTEPGWQDFYFLFYLRIQQCHLFPTGQRTREVLHVRIQEGKEGKDRDTA